MPDCMCRGNNPNCFRCNGTGTIGQLSANRDLSEEKFAKDLKAIIQRPSIRIPVAKIKTKSVRATSQFSLQHHQPPLDEASAITICPNCGVHVKLKLLERHLKESCKKESPTIPTLYSDTQAKQLLAKHPAKRSPCPHCGIEMRADRIEGHIKERCPKVRFAKLPKLESYNKPMTIPWVCPECFASICPPEASQSAALEFLRKHEQEVHPDKTAKVTLKPIRASQIPVALILCSRCGEMVKENSTGLHSLTCNPSLRRPGALDVPVSQLGFVLLAPGTWNIQDVIKHYRNQSHAFPIDLQGRKIDNSRLEKMASLQPLRCYIGKESWSGYVVFEFQDTNRVVLECPFEGNATYVLSGDWRLMVRHTKLEMRLKFPRSYERIIHSGDWFAKLRSSLGVAKHTR